MVLSPAILQPYTKKITGSDDLALGHFGSVGYFIAGFLGKRVGNTAHSTEDIKVPRSLGFLRDTSVSISLTMALLFFIVAPFAGKGYIESSLSGGSHYLVYSFMQAITFAAGVYIILAGVRMVIAEIVPAFKGIAEKLVKGAKPALDCPTVFPFAPNAVIIGFLSSFLAGLSRFSFFRSSASVSLFQVLSLIFHRSGSRGLWQCDRRSSRSRDRGVYQWSPYFFSAGASLAGSRFPRV